MVFISFKHFQELNEVQMIYLLEKSISLILLLLKSNNIFIHVYCIVYLNVYIYIYILKDVNLFI